MWTLVASLLVGTALAKDPCKELDVQKDPFGAQVRSSVFCVTPGVFCLNKIGFTEVDGQVFFSAVAPKLVPSDHASR